MALWSALGPVVAAALAAAAPAPAPTAAVPTPAAAAAAHLTALADGHVARLRKNLRESIVAFWYPRAIDRENGGYLIDFGPAGEPRGPGTRMIVSQARTVWLFARLHRGGHGGKELLAAADHGFRFLRDRMWDRASGGFYWEVDATGRERRKPGKHLYGQAFALYALAEYHLASGRKDVLALATRLFLLLEEKAHDRVHGGYREFFTADWKTPPPGEKSYVSGVPAEMKLMNTHLHLLEAMTTFYRASRLPLARERLLELIAIQSGTVVRKPLGACTDKYDADWTPRTEGDFGRVSYGHDLENVWLLADAAEAAGLPNQLLLDTYRTLWDYSLRHGYDEAQGGFFDSGPPGAAATARQKVWWVQAEALVSALTMLRLTGEARYARVFTQTYDFIEKHQVDWKNGGWHPVVRPDGRAEGDKAGPWKAGYHDGRAMIECLRMLEGAGR